ncbi:hypothetical protein H6S07_24730 (plasmid) [Escherichia coli]|nr:hypothetical protein H6S07_24730 [Escherichia coli]
MGKIQNRIRAPTRSQHRAAKRITVADAINYWLDNYVRARRKVRLVISRMNTYIISTIGSRPLDECSAGDWRDCFSK